jgi:zinc protease
VARRTMIRSVRMTPWVIGIAALALAIGARAQEAKAPSAAAGPSVDRIIQHYIEAIGGRAAIEKFTSRASLGKIEVPSMNLTGTVMMEEKAPDKLLQTVVINGNIFRQGFDGANAWSDDPADGLRVLSGMELAEAKRDADFFHPLHLHEIYADLAYAGTEKVGDREAYAITGTAAGESAPDKMYFDEESGLVLRVITHRHTPDGEANVQEDFSNYQAVDGLMLPFTILQTGGSAEFTIRMDQIRHGVDLKDSEFAEPKAGDSKVQ